MSLKRSRRALLDVTCGLQLSFRGMSSDNLNWNNKACIDKEKDHVLTICENIYGIDSGMISLVTELGCYNSLDLVYKIDFENNVSNSLIMKTSNYMETPIDRIDLQVQAMNQLILHGLPATKPMKKQKREFENDNMSDSEYVYFDSIKKSNVIIYNYIQGTQAKYIHDEKKNLSFYYNIGKTIGQISKALINFQHNASNFEFEWDLQMAQSYFDDNYKYINDSYSKKADGYQLKVWKYYYNLYCTDLLPYVKYLRQSIYHGDLSDLNIIVNDELETEIVGILDFGDCKQSCTIFEIAIAIAYFMLEQDNPLDILIAMIQGYHKEFALKSNEIDILYVAIMSRLLQSVTNGSKQIATNGNANNGQNEANDSDVDINQIHSKPAWVLLEQMMNYHPANVTQMIKESLTNK